MTSIVFPDLPIEDFYYSQQSKEMDLGEWTITKPKNERLLDTVETEAAGWVVWPPILSSDCNSTWLATRKAKAEEKEKRDESLSQWLVQSAPEDTHKIDYVAAIREGFEKSMDAFANCLRESIKVDVESEDKSIICLNPWLVSSSTATAAERVVSPDSTKTGEEVDKHLNPWLVSSTPPSSPIQTIVEGVNKFLVELNLENNSTAPARTSSTAPARTSSSFDDQTGPWLSMSDSGRAESIISEAMSNMKMDTEEDASKAALSTWLVAETQDVYTFDGVESEASIEIIDPTLDFETMDEI